MAWRHRDERYAEKLATPDTSVADLIGDVDPMKVAEGRSLGDPETIHFGLIPRSHRGIVAINELPDLAERIQVAMLNVMEERDIQIRGYMLRLPLDVLVVASANPEDYTNRGRIITPLKDRFGAEIRTHYPLELDDEVGVIGQEAELVAEVPDYLIEILARFTRELRESSAVDQRPGCQRAVRDRRRRDDRRRGAAPRAVLGRGASRWPGWSIWRRRSTCWAARSSSSPARRAARRRSSTTCCGARPPRPRPGRSPASTSVCSSTAIESGVDGDHRRAGGGARLPRGLSRRCESIDEVCERLGARTTASAPARSNSRWRGCTWRKIGKESGGGETVYG